MSSACQAQPPCELSKTHAVVLDLLHLILDDFGHQLGKLLNLCRAAGRVTLLSRGIS